MIGRRSDLPFHRDPVARFLPALVAFLVFVAILALAGALAIGRTAAGWDQGIRGAITVQVPVDDQSNADETGATDAARADEAVAAALALLRSVPGVAAAEPIPPAEAAVLLEPWVADPSLLSELPVPRLIDVRLEAGAVVDARALEARLQPVAPGALVADHGVWLADLLRLTQAVEVMATGLVALVGLATAATVAFATRSGLAIHRDAIELLHLIGARDSYVARQFASRSLVLSLWGGLIGLVLAIPAVAGVGALWSRLAGEVVPVPELGTIGWAMLPAVPIAAAVIAMLTARITVLRALARMA